MADRRRPTPVRQPNSIVASAELLTATRIPRGGLPKTTGWQEDAWAFYDEVGELRFGVAWLQNALSRVRIMAARTGTAGDEPIVIPDPDSVGLDDDPLTASEIAAYDLMTALAGGTQGQAEMMSACATQLALPGIGWIVGEPIAPAADVVDQQAAIDDSAQTWQVLSNDELTVTSVGSTKLFTIKTGDGAADRRVLSPDAVAVKFWRPHHRHHWRPDSPTRAALPVLRELVLLSQHIDASAVSRLAGAGILIVPTEVEFPVSEKNQDAEDPFVAELTDAMAVPIGDRGVASAVVPFTIKVPGEYVDRVKHISFSTPFDDKAMALREEAIKRLAAAMDLPAEVVLGLADSNHWCQDEDTEALVRGRGWTRHDEVAVGDEVLTLNHDFGYAEWCPVDDKYEAPVVDEPMHRMESRSHSSLSTPGHRWPVEGADRAWTTSAEGFKTSERVALAAPLLEDQAVIAKHEDDFVRLVVAYVADGTRQRHGNVRIAKFSPREVIELRRVLTSLYGADGFREHDHPTRTICGTAFVLRQAEAAALLDLCDPATKAMPLSFVDDLTAAQRRLLLDSCRAIGDGVGDEQATTLLQVEPSRLDAFAYAAHLCGLKVTCGVRRQQTGYGTRPLSWVRWSTRRRTFDPSSCRRTMEPYSGVVWCPVTRNGTWFARRNGTAYFTGNTAWQIGEAALTLHIEPMAAAVCAGLTTGYLQPALAALGIDDPDFIVWYDTTELKVRPDRSQDAKDLYDRHVVGATTLRREAGFGAEDIPTEDELREALLLDVLRGAPTLFPIIAPALGINIVLPDVAPLPAGGSGGASTPSGGPEGSSGQQGPVSGAPEQPTRPPAETPPQSVAASGSPAEAAIVEAADAIVTRALERAGHRLRNRARAAGVDVDESCPADEVHVCAGMDTTALTSMDTLLDGAWDRVDEVAARYDLDGEAFRVTLDGYTRALLASARRHDFALLASVIGPGH